MVVRPLDPLPHLPERVPGGGLPVERRGTKQGLR